MSTDCTPAATDDVTAYRHEVINWILDLDTTPQRRATLLFLARRIDRQDRFETTVGDLAEYLGVTNSVALGRFRSLLQAKLAMWDNHAGGTKGERRLHGILQYAHSPRYIAQRTRFELWLARMNARYEAYGEAREVVNGAAFDIAYDRELDNTHPLESSRGRREWDS